MEMEVLLRPQNQIHANHPRRRRYHHRQNRHLDRHRCRRHHHQSPHRGRRLHHQAALQKAKQEKISVREF